MKLHLLRHAIAAERDAELFPDDSTRPMTEIGRKKMEQAARGMKTLGLEFDRILTSPYLRALDTAKIVAAELGLETKLTEEPRLAADQPIEAILSKLGKLAKGAQSVLLVGHEPFLSELASPLLGISESDSLHMKKGGLCRLEIARWKPTPQAHLAWWLTPKQLRALG